MTSGSPDPYRARQSGASRPARRPRGRLTLLPIAVAVWAILEIWLFILIGEAASGMTVFLLLAAGLLAGALVIRHAGRRAWQRLTAQARGEVPADKPGQDSSSGVLTMLGGLLLILPGLISDVVGLVLIFPPTARLLRRRAKGALERRTWPAGPAFRAANEARRRRGQGGQVIQGEVVPDEEPGAGPEGRPDRDRDRD
ncbi:FxsA family membrane protein [Streptomyces sp. DSM 44915]|uniref:FxsA family membrane protein n=1 Tax=Streptomyces chisholmiae TaxID=3075540 RepID=A0ABU2JX54_9ACTN|nr:FxsA family membrane protein [Streptomyces sp. DSM 44915]MDT0268808.1 FxsA family membrane protein [Streptomyces sp. DSM 44915]